VTEQQELPTALEGIKKRVSELREVIASLATLHVLEHRVSDSHPIRLVCDWILREFWLATDQLEVYTPLAGDPCPFCSQSVLAHRLTDCNGCGELTCERIQRFCEDCILPTSGDCSDCCTSPEKGEVNCRVQFWRPLAFFEEADV
jgi:hypothetical protein